jgi:AcrR family transcriptional regulator
MPDEIRPTSRRERGKDARRSRIVDAAYALLREVGVDELSVKMIADRADLSPATVYNLFGAKAAVLAKVYERDFEGFSAKVARAGSPSALDAIFDSVRIAVDLYRGDPSFYRGMSIRHPQDERELVISVQGPRQAFFRDLLARAVREGDLAQAARTDLASLVMLQMSGGAFGYWCADLISLDEMEMQTSYAFALLLMGLARPPGRTKLQARVAAIEARLAPEAQRPTATATAG